VNIKLSMKAQKHEKIKVLVEAKLNTINDHVSKTVKDDRISAEEYSLILSELAKFIQMKEEIRTKMKASFVDGTLLKAEIVQNNNASVFRLIGMTMDIRISAVIRIINYPLASGYFTIRADIKKWWRSFY
jgi:hypothetical protein